MKKLLTGLMAVAATLILTACGQETAKDSWPTIEKNKEVVIGFDNTFVPMGFKDENGDNVGFDIDLAKAVFDQYGIKVKMQPIDWDTKEVELKTGKIDLIWNGYSVTPAREKQVLFTKPYMINDQVLVTKKSSDITKVAEMKGKKLGAQQGSSGYDAFTSQPEILQDIVADNDAQLYEDFNSAMMDLDAGRIDGLLIDAVYANYYLTTKGTIKDYNIIHTGYTTEDFAVGARKGDKVLVDKINTAIAKLHEDGEFQKISEKWFSEDVYPAK